MPYQSKALRNIEEKMVDLDPSSLRYHVLESAKNFKVSWLELGRALYSVWRDKAYKEWNFNDFEAYAAREIGIRKHTAMKLLRSYYFLEKEEPEYLKEGYLTQAKTTNLPSYESVDLLRLAKNRKNLSKDDYENLKRDIFEEGKDARQIRRNLAVMIRERQQLDPEELDRHRRLATVKRLLGTLKSLKKEAEILKLLPTPILKETTDLIKKLEEELK
jgi:hypothetical protein